MLLSKGVMADNARFLLQILPESVEILSKTASSTFHWNAITTTFATYCNALTEVQCAGWSLL